MQTQINYISDPLTLKKHYATLAARASESWYQDRKFFVLPELSSGLYTSLVLPYTQWLMLDQTRQKFDELPNNYEWEDIWNSDCDFSAIDLNNQLQADLKESQDKWPEIVQVLPKLAESWAGFFNFPIVTLQIDILPVHFGTGCSFYRFLEDDHLRMLIIPRTDVTFLRIIRAFIQNLVVYHHTNIWEYDVDLWLSRRRIGDFLFANSRITHQFAGQDLPLAEQLLQESNLQVELKQKSNQYLTEIRFPLGGNAELDWGLLKTVLSLAELKLAKYLHDHFGQIQTYDQLAQILYADNWEDKFSLEYMAKLIQEIRRKLAYHGHNSVIFTQRGVGYGWF